MQSIQVSDQTYNNLVKIYYSKMILNTESTIMSIKDFDSNKILKKFNMNWGDFLKSKIYTIDCLNEYKDILPDSFVIPETQVLHRNENIGVLMPKVKGITLTELLKTSENTQYKLQILKRIGLLLKQLEVLRKRFPEVNIFINDLHESNIMIDEIGNIKLVDLDSCKIKDNKVFQAKYLSPCSFINYIPDKYKKNDKLEESFENATNDPSAFEKGLFSEGIFMPSNDTDLYCYYVMLMNFLTGVDNVLLNFNYFSNILSIMEDSKVSKELIRSFEKIVLIDPNENPYPYIEYIDERQINKVKEKVKRL